VKTVKILINAVAQLYCPKNGRTAKSLIGEAKARLRERNKNVCNSQRLHFREKRKHCDIIIQGFSVQNKVVYKFSLFLFVHFHIILVSNQEKQIMSVFDIDYVTKLMGS
jgi:hypothetical protein